MHGLMRWEVCEERHVGFLEGAPSLDDGERDGKV
jgi:hypothetical protein